MGRAHDTLGKSEILENCFCIVRYHLMILVWTLNTQDILLFVWCNVEPFLLGISIPFVNIFKLEKPPEELHVQNYDFLS